MGANTWLRAAAIAWRCWLGRAAGRDARPGDASDAIGRWGEDCAADLLAGEGYRILGRRVRPNRHDEIDLVVRRDDVLVFVEVKTRKTEDFGRPLEAVDRDKRRALVRAAARYLRRLGYPRVYCRFDTVEVIGAPGGKPVVRHIENAFLPAHPLMPGR